MVTILANNCKEVFILALILQLSFYDSFIFFFTSTRNNPMKLLDESKKYMKARHESTFLNLYYYEYFISINYISYKSVFDELSTFQRFLKPRI